MSSVDQQAYSGLFKAAKVICAVTPSADISDELSNLYKSAKITAANNVYGTTLRKATKAGNKLRVRFVESVQKWTRLRNVLRSH